MLWNSWCNGKSTLFKTSFVVNAMRIMIIHSWMLVEQKLMWIYCRISPFFELMISIARIVFSSNAISLRSKCWYELHKYPTSRKFPHDVRAMCLPFTQITKIFPNQLKVVKGICQATFRRKVPCFTTQNSHRIAYRKSNSIKKPNSLFKQRTEAI